jgi:hypothetical protein
MKRKRYVPLVCTALLCLLLASCLDSKSPLSDPQQAKADARLAGVWRLEEGADVTYYHVGRLGEGFPKGMMGALWITHSEGGKLAMDAVRTVVFPTTNAESTYLNVGVVDEGKWRASEEKPSKELRWHPEIVEGYFICKYQVKGDTLVLQRMDADAKAQAIKSGVIKGRIDENNPIITDTTENLLRFVTAHDKELFKETMLLKRVK